MKKYMISDIEITESLGDMGIKTYEYRKNNEEIRCFCFKNFNLEFNLTLSETIRYGNVISILVKDVQGNRVNIDDCSIIFKILGGLRIPKYNEQEVSDWAKSQDDSEGETVLFSNIRYSFHRGSGNTYMFLVTLL